MTNHSQGHRWPDMSIIVRGWWGRKDGNSPAWCSQSGWRETVWVRDPVLGWLAESATLRPVVGMTAKGKPILGKARKVK